MNFSIPATLASYTPTADKGIAIRFRSRQEVGSDEFAKIHAAYQQEGVVIFAQGELSPEEIETAKAQTVVTMKDGKGRSMSEALRGALRRAWEQGSKLDDPDEEWKHYYKRRMLVFKAIVLEELRENER